VTPVARQLCRLLLGSDGTFVCCRPDECALDRGALASFRSGETNSPFGRWIARIAGIACYRDGCLDAVIFEAMMSCPLRGTELACAAERPVVARFDLPDLSPRMVALGATADKGRNCR
jgi:hypothetical protein